MEFRIGDYHREVLHRGGGLEAVRITWPPGARTIKHDHCASKGHIWVLEGRVFEVKDGKKTCYATGDSFPEIGPGEKHIVGNDGREEAKTFHIFTPELEMTDYPDEECDIRALTT